MDISEYKDACKRQLITKQSYFAFVIMSILKYFYKRGACTAEEMYNMVNEVFSE